MEGRKNSYRKGVLQNLNLLPRSEYSDFRFIGRLDIIRNFYNGMRGLHFGDIGVVQITTDGLRFVAENGKAIQASLFITASCFQEFHITDAATFGISINVLIECLGIFSRSDCSMKMFYKNTNEPLVIILEPQGDEHIVTECRIKTSVFDEPMDLMIDENSGPLNMICMPGPALAKIFNEIDKSAIEIDITLSPRSPFFRIDVLGVMQSESSYEVSKNSDIMYHFNCSVTTKACYKYSHIKLMAKAMNAAKKAAIKTNASGLLEFQFMLQSDNDSEIYIEFILTPIVQFS